VHGLLRTVPARPVQGGRDGVPAGGGAVRCRRNVHRRLGRLPARSVQGGRDSVPCGDSLQPSRGVHRRLSPVPAGYRHSAQWRAVPEYGGQAVLQRSVLSGVQAHVRQWRLFLVHLET
jgi:hypothetical protein